LIGQEGTSASFGALERLKYNGLGPGAGGGGATYVFQVTQLITDALLNVNKKAYIFSDFVY